MAAAALRALTLALLLAVHAVGCSSSVPYRLGNFAASPAPPHKTTRSIMDHVSCFCTKHGARSFRIGVFLYHTRCAVESIFEDSWEAVRNPVVFAKRIRHEGERKVVMQRTRRSNALRSLSGAGYTPRLVWLFGVMLRGLFLNTAMPRIFDPPIGWGAGSVAAARFAHREWLPCVMLGWYGSGYYWKTIFGVTGPPDGFGGVSISIHGVRV